MSVYFDNWIHLHVLLGTNCFPISGPETGKPCIFPFLYKGVIYDECTNMDHDQKWCSTKVYSAGTHVDGKYGHCGNDCKSGKFEKCIQKKNVITKRIQWIQFIHEG